MQYSKFLIWLLCILLHQATFAGSNNKFVLVSISESLKLANTKKSLKSKKEVVYYDKPDIVYKQQPYNQRRYYKPNYVKSYSRFCDPYWRKPFKGVSFGFDI